MNHCFRIPTCALLFLFTIVSSPLFGEGRTFTNREGKTIKAKVVEISGGNVTLEKEGKKFVFPISTLSDSDIQYLKSWYSSNVDFTARVSVFHKQGDSPAGTAKRTQTPNPLIYSTPEITYNGGTTASTVASVEKDYFLVTITNDVAVPMKNVEVKYEIYVRETQNSAFKGAKSKHNAICGEIEIAEIGAGQTMQVYTPTISLENRESKTTQVTTIVYTNEVGNQWTERSSKTRKNRNRSEIRGYQFQIYHKGKMIKETKKVNAIIEGAIKNHEMSRNTNVRKVRY